MPRALHNKLRDWFCAPFFAMDSNAKAEYTKGNFDLALEMYEELVSAHPNHGELSLGKAQTLAQLSRLEESFVWYKRAKLTTDITEDNLMAVVDGSMKIISDSCKGTGTRDTNVPNLLRVVTCNVCVGILYYPVTLPCGHSTCEPCLKKLTSKKCKTCGDDLSTYKLKTNVILQQFLQKNFEKELQSVRLRSEGNVLLKDGKLSDSFKKYQEAENLYPDDHLIQSNLSHILLSMGKFDEALAHASRACELQPSWPKLLYKIFMEEAEHDITKAESKSEESPLTDVFSKIAKNISCSSAHEDNDEPCEKKPRTGLADATVGDFECTLCCRLLYHPVTTPCGHVFCRACLNRSLDHRPGCPICRNCLSEVLATRKENVTIAVEELLQNLFPEEYNDRKKQHEEDLALLASVASNTSEEIPVFVCTLAVPLMPCPLHIFEPRYRLMVRQCVESGSRQFGMCMYDEDQEFSEYGTMLEIRDVRYLPDGRSLVDTIGGRRFKVLSRGMRDGYSVARVQWIRDDPVPEADLTELKAFHKAVYDQTFNWFNSLPLLVRRRVVSTSSDMPDWEDDTETKPNGAGWLWWLVSVCPLDPKAQVRLLGMTSLRERLEVLQRLLVLVT